MLLFWPHLETAALLLLGAFATHAAESSAHSLRYFSTFVSEPGQGLPQFISVGYVDDQVICQYDSNNRTVQRRVSWMEKADAQYWDKQTKIMRGKEAELGGDMATLRNHYNQSKGGFHTWQEISSCELRKDGSIRGHLQYAYDGKDFISLDMENLTWTAADVPAQITKRKWEAEPAFAQGQKLYLEEDCIELLQKFLDYGKEMLLRIQPPVGKVTRQATGDSQEALICQAHGFYPKEIEATWRKGKEILEHETFRRNIAPNFDETYHTWLSIEIDPKERDLYRCHVDHAGLPEPLVLALEEPDVYAGIIVVTVLVFVLPVVNGIICCFLRASDNTSDSCIRATQNNSDRSSRCIRSDQNVPAETLQRPSSRSPDFVRIKPQLVSP